MVFCAIAAASPIAAQESPYAKMSKWKVGKVLYTPFDVSRIAAADAATVQPEYAYYTRYLSLHNIPLEQRDAYAASVSFLLNSLSREPEIVLPPRVGQDGVLLRINLRKYSISPLQWDRMGDVSPYFNEDIIATSVLVRQTSQTRRVLKTWDGNGLWKDGKAYPAGSFTYYVDEEIASQTQQQVGRAVRKRAIASWLDPQASAYLVDKLQSTAPIIRADWFLANACLPPFYYDLLGLKTLDDAKELALYDRRAERFTQAKATIVFSGRKGRRVANNNRILEEVDTVFGSFWQTHDFEESIGEKNVLRNFLNAKRDGGEIIFTLPNKLQAYFLVNKDDKRVDEVPIKIAGDSTSLDFRVRNGKSCIICHAQGMQPFDTDFKLVINPQTLVHLGIIDKHDPRKALELTELIHRVFSYPDFTAIIKRDNDRYAFAVKRCNGRSAPDNAALFRQVYEDYQDYPIDAERLVYEAGVPDMDIQAIVQIKVEGTSDPVLLRRLLNLPIRRDHWEEVYPVFMRATMAWLAVRPQVKPPQKKMPLIKEQKQQAAIPPDVPQKIVEKEPDSAKVEIAEKDRTFNNGPLCVWAAIDTLIRHHNVKHAEGQAMLQPAGNHIHVIEFLHQKRVENDYLFLKEESERLMAIKTLCQTKTGACLAITGEMKDSLHAIILVGYSADKVEYIDPNSPSEIQSLSFAALSQRWTGHTFIVYPSISAKEDVREKLKR